MNIQNGFLFPREIPAYGFSMQLVLRLKAAQGFFVGVGVGAGRTVSRKAPRLMIGFYIGAMFLL